MGHARRARAGRRQVQLTAAAAVGVLVAAVLSVPVVQAPVASAPSRPLAARAALHGVDAAAPVPSVVPVAPAAPSAPAAAPVHRPPTPPTPGRPWPAPQPGVAPEADPVERGRAALAALDYPWAQLGFSVRFVPWDGGPLLGQTEYATRRITVFVQPRQSELSLRATVAHELGHALDVRTGDAAQRSRYLQLRGVPADTPWYPCDRCDDFASPAGDWAEVFALWLAGPGDFHSALAAAPDDGGLRDIARLFAPPSARAPAAADSPAPPPAPSPTPAPSPSPTLLPWLPH